MRLLALLVALALVAVPTREGALYGVIPYVADAPRAPEPPVPDPAAAEAWRLARRLVWEDGLVARPFGGLDEALREARALEAGRDKRDAFFAWIVGEDAWEAAAAAALDHEWETGEYTWTGLWLTEAQRAAEQRAWDAALVHEERLRLQWPVTAPHRVSSRFGPRIHPIHRDVRVHAGVDVAVPIGTEIRAAHDGVVKSARSAGGGGRTVIVDHGHGLETAYLHLDG